MYKILLRKPEDIDGTCLLTYSMVQSPSWAASWFAASREILRISRDPKVHYRTHKHPRHWWYNNIIKMPLQ